MYKIDERSSGSLFRQSYRRDRNGSVIVAHRERTWRSIYELMYSWRTGRRAMETSQRSNQHLFGIAVPSKDGSLVNRLESRKKFIEDLDRNLNVSGSLGNNNQTAGRSSRSDTGHEFSKITVFASPITGFYRYRWGAGDYDESRVTGVPSNQGTIGNPIAWSPRSFRLDQKISYSSVQKQMSDVFANMSPEHEDASILVSAVELLRGDVPSVLKNFRKYWDEGQSLAKTLGSEYLNISFGWTPLMNEFAGIVKHFMTLDRLLYYDSTRRHRHWVGPSASSTVQTANAVVASNQNLNSLSYTRDSQAQLTSGGISGTVLDSYTWFQDYRLSARFAGIARPSRAADMFNDKALAVLGNLGIVNDPDLVWELAPFSWLADWAVNIGSGMENATYYSKSNGGRSIDYAYVSTKTTVSEERRVLTLNAQPVTTTQRIDNGKSSIVTTQLDRRRVSPFGIGVDLSGLSSGQFNILVALGLAKSR